MGEMESGQEHIANVDRKATYLMLSEYGQRESWPTPQHRNPEVTGILIDSKNLPAALARHQAQIEELALMADVIRNLQTKSGNFALPQLATEISTKAFGHISDICEFHEIEHHIQRHISKDDPLRWVSSSLSGSLDSLPQGRYFIHWGPLGTWRKKSSNFLHSFLLAAFNDEVGLEVDNFNELCENSFDDHFMQLLRADDLTHSKPPYFYCADSIARGGEAAVAPYHFAYFFPEDHGLPIAEENTVIFFVDSYKSRFEHVSLKLAKLFVDEKKCQFDQNQLFRGQILWLRGHDISHGIKTSRTDWKRIEAEFGHGMVSVLGEVLADIYGLLFLYKREVLEQHAIDRASVTYSFLAEMLNYLRRDAELFFDSSAAYLEASFLLSCGALVVDSASRIYWEEDAFQIAALSFAETLYDSLLNTDIEKIRDLITSHSFELQSSLHKQQISRLATLIKEAKIHV